MLSYKKTAKELSLRFKKFFKISQKYDVGGGHYQVKLIVAISSKTFYS